MKVYSQPEIVMDKIWGKHICAVRGVDSYLTVQQPGADGTCPEGLIACSSRTSTDNTVCYPENEWNTLCPITGMKLEIQKDYQEDMIS